MEHQRRVVDIKNEANNLVKGLSESEFMSRQRYLENSSFPSVCNRSVSVISNPQHPTLMSSTDIHNFVQEQRGIIANFKSQPWPMDVKIAALRKYKQNLSKYAEQMNSIDTFRDKSKKVFRILYKLCTSMIRSLTIWNSIIKRIEGRFGSGVASFFILLRWLCALNLAMALIIISFIVLPQLISGNGLPVPDSVRQNGTALSFIFDGKGYIMEYSVLFYGFYDSGRNEPFYPPPHNPNPELGSGYKLPLAYMIVTVLIFVISILAILLNMGEKYKFLQRASVKEQYMFAWRVFASWDHTITNKESAMMKSQHLTISLKETILEVESKAVKNIRWKFVSIRIATNLLVLILLILSGYAIYLAVDNIDYTANSTQSIAEAIEAGWNGLLYFVLSFQVQAVITARNMLLPYIFQIVKFIENHQPRMALKMMLARLFLLYISSLGVLIVSLFTLNRQCVFGISQAQANTSDAVLSWISSIGRATSSSNNTTNFNAQNMICCWETVIGQELFKLTLTHFFAELVNIALSDFFRWGLVQSRLWPRLTKWIGLAEFDLAENILKLVYAQAILWFGILYCPLLPLISYIKTIILFYIRCIAVTICNKPPSAMFRVASTQTFYMALLLFIAFLCTFPLGFALIQLTPSTICGPFRGLSSMAGIVTNEVLQWPMILQAIVNYCTTATVIVPFIALLCIILYYYRAMASAFKEVNNDLRFQLHVERTATKERIKRDAINSNIISSPSLNRHEVLIKQVQDYDNLKTQIAQFAAHHEHFIQVNPQPSQPPQPKRVQIRESHDEIPREENIPMEWLPTNQSIELSNGVMGGVTDETMGGVMDGATDGVMDGIMYELPVELSGGITSELSGLSGGVMGGVTAGVMDNRLLTDSSERSFSIYDYTS
jgi:hypothetical protein